MLDGEILFSMTAAGTKTNGINLDYICVTEAQEETSVAQKKKNVVPLIHYENDCVEYQYHYGENPLYFNIL